MQLRDYQFDCLTAIESGWSEFNRQLVVMPTGSGKTILFSHLALCQSGRTLILAHREELIDQACAKLQAATGVVADVEKADRFARLDARVVVGSIQTMMNPNRRQGFNPNHFNLVVCDEAHHVLSKSWQNSLAWFDGCRVLGVTATPDRGDKRNLGTYFQSIAYEVGLFDLIDKGWLSPITVKSIPLKIDLNQVKQSGGDFEAEGLGNAIEPYLNQIAQAIVEHASFRKVLVFCPLIATSIKFVQACQDVGLDAVHIDGQSDDRKCTLNDFANCDFDLLSNAMLLTEGYDDPTIDCVVILRPTRSRPLYAQMVGRGTRIATTKDDLLLLDFLWLHETHKVCHPSSLIAQSNEEAEAIDRIIQSGAKPGDVAETLEMDLQEAGSSATAAREAALRRKLEEAARRKPKLISAEQFAMQHGKISLVEYEPIMPWESEPLTTKQAWHLQRAKIDLDTVKGKGHASKLLSILFENQQIELASPKAIALMRRYGVVNNDEVVTQAMARRFFAERNRR